MRDALAPLVEALPTHVAHVELPTPFPVGPVNCYLVAGDPVTLVDPGMLHDDTFDLIGGLLAAAGLRVADVERVVVTHAHPDHYGAAGWVISQSGGRIVCGRAEIAKLESRFDRPGYQDLLGVLGIPDDIRAGFGDLYGGIRALVHDIPGESLDPVDDGDCLVVGGTPVVAHVTPGHATGHLSLWDDASRTLFSGDHLLPRITPNPVLEPDDSDLGRRRSLVEYLDSLDRFVALDPEVVLPGHGPAFTDLPALVTGVRSHHEERAAVILDLVERNPGSSPHELSGRLFPTLSGFGVMLGVSEVIGHLDLLLDAGAVIEERGPVLRYLAS
ncbi:MAG TPA: MBL fold metallo-hydrolase [Acidimicrobiales bacterium]|nr:MBL fold metallo-hydrolase [Acidimicrobiales bacterium]